MYNKILKKYGLYNFSKKSLRMFFVGISLDGSLYCWDCRLFSFVHLFSLRYNVADPRRPALFPSCAERNLTAENVEHVCFDVCLDIAGNTLLFHDCAT